MERFFPKNKYLLVSPRKLATDDDDTIIKIPETESNGGKHAVVTLLAAAPDCMQFKMEKLGTGKLLVVLRHMLDKIELENGDAHWIVPESAVCGVINGKKKGK